MIEERRTQERVQTRLDARWEGVLARREGTVVDISPGGCFILTADDVMPRELIRLEISLPTGRSIYLWGEVVYKAEEMGFALRFTGCDDTELRMLEELIAFVGAV